MRFEKESRYLLQPIFENCLVKHDFVDEADQPLSNEYVLKYFKDTDKFDEMYYAWFNSVPFFKSRSESRDQELKDIAQIVFSGGNPLNDDIPLRSILNTQVYLICLKSCTIKNMLINYIYQFRI